MTGKYSFGPHPLCPSGLCFGTMQFGVGASKSDSAVCIVPAAKRGLIFLIPPMFIIAGLRNSGYADCKRARGYHSGDQSRGGWW